MKTRLWATLVLMLVGFSARAQTLSGKEIFAGNCTACHSIGGGDILGPDLAGVTERREADWIKSFITNSQQMIAAGDEVAAELFNKYNKIPMPPHKFSDEELNNLLSYLEEAGPEAVAETTLPKGTPEIAEAQVVKAGSPEMPMSVKVILCLLSTAAVILSITAIYLLRMLRS
ncbi:c-type cytochrome [Nafulsella turpanensis]|uniref:c-type cytochrome n=1 Tax=Nafulsella turpanensis TaxID=1265690 RepID=UPI00034D1669|nr:cytochrome c [Nafulsella turpanensis]